MLGAIIGDIIGSRWEFCPTNDYNFEWLSDENGFTDDTICTVGVADASGSWGSVLLIIFYVENLDVESWGVKNDV